MSTAKVLGILIGTAVVAVFLGFILGKNVSHPALISQPSNPESSPSVTTTSTIKTTTNSSKKPEASKGPVEALTVKGTIVSFDNHNLVVKTTEDNKTIPIDQVIEKKGFQKIVSGSIDSGSKVAVVSFTDLKVGQEVVVAVDKATGEALTVIITK